MDVLFKDLNEIKRNFFIFLVQTFPYFLDPIWDANQCIYGLRNNLFPYFIDVSSNSSKTTFFIL